MQMKNKKVPVWVLVIALFFSVTLSFGTALTVLNIPLEKMGLWSGEQQNTDFSVLQIVQSVKGKNKVSIWLQLKNTDVNDHTANVTVQLLDNLGDVIIEASKLTGSVSGDAIWSTTYVFTYPGLVSLYESPLVVISQDS